MLQHQMNQLGEHLPQPAASGPVISVVIVNWNSLRFLRPCLASLYGGALHQPFEVIVVDNASREPGVEQVVGPYPDITLIRNRENRGFAGANNQALRRCRGRYVLLLNPDTVLYPGSIDRLWELLEQHPAAGAAGPQLLSSAGRPMESYCSFPGPHLLWRGLITALKADFAIYQEQPDHTPLLVDWVGGACMLLRRQALDQVGMLDESFFIYFEEADLCWRLRDAGWETYYVPEAQVVHHQGGSSATAPDGVYLDGILLDQWARSADQFLRKHLPAWTWLTFRCLTVGYTLLVLGIWGALYAVRPADRPRAARVLQAYWRFFRQIPSLLSWPRPAQATARRTVRARPDPRP